MIDDKRVTHIWVIQGDSCTRKDTFVFVLLVHRKAYTALLQRAIDILMGSLNLEVPRCIAFAGNVGDLSDLNYVPARNDIRRGRSKVGWQGDEGGCTRNKGEEGNERESSHCSERSVLLESGRRQMPKERGRSKEQRLRRSESKPTGSFKLKS